MDKMMPPRREINIPAEAEYMIMDEVSDSVVINIYDLPPPP
jgi:hypothetical protein